MSDAHTTAAAFFDRYERALLDRDEKAMADLYAVPALILFPGVSIAVADRSQTEQFFAASWSQYDGIDALDHDIDVMAETAASVWTDVTWSWDGQPRERFCYQLVPGGTGLQVAVLTPLDLDRR